MTATNHALTGAAIGLSIGNPWLALPIAFFSHFICDIIPHFGVTRPTEEWIGSRTFRRFLTADAVVCTLLVIVLGVTQVDGWMLASLCAFLATSPDLMWVMRFVRTQKQEADIPSTNWNWLMRFHKKIQWFERPSGAVVEILWAPAMVLLLHMIVS